MQFHICRVRVSMQQKNHLFYLIKIKLNFTAFCLPHWLWYCQWRQISYPSTLKTRPYLKKFAVFPIRLDWDLWINFYGHFWPLNCHFIRPLTATNLPRSIIFLKLRKVAMMAVIWQPWRWI
jgi:hypothetical protein